MLQTIAGGAAVILGSLVFVVGLLWMVRRQWPPTRLKATNEVVSAYGSAIGTTYAVILAFMLSGVWMNYDAAQANAEQEANAVVQVFRLAEGLPEPHRHQVKTLAHAYARAVLDTEWPKMQSGRIGLSGRQLHDQLWRCVLAIQPHGSAREALLAQMMESLSELRRHRAQRELDVRQGLPPILWGVLAICGIITIGIFSLFGVEDFRLHALKSGALTLVVVVLLVAIADIDRPFQGYVRVTPESFQLALATMDRLGMQ
jgi:hypothetical protein